jgi:hypothetical protein
LKTSRQLEDCRASRCTAVKDSFNLTRLWKCLKDYFLGNSGWVHGTCPELSHGYIPYERETIPGGLPPSFYHQEVTSANIRREKTKVKKARKRLAEAMRAENLAREAEWRSSQDEWS